MNPTIAFFYRNPEILQFNSHKGLRFRPVRTVDFAAKQTAAPIVLAEFSAACLEYPIVFARGESDSDWIAIVVTGLQPEQNVFVDANGEWRGRYVPASIRRYPFVLAKTGGDDFSVAADLDAPHFEKSGELVFNTDGSPSDVMRDVLSLLQEFQAQADITSKFISRLMADDLLQETTVNVQLPDLVTHPIGKIWMVNEQKLLAASDDLLLNLAKSGELGFIYAHLLSLRNLSSLMARAEETTTAVSKRSGEKVHIPKQSAVKSPENPPKQKAAPIAKSSTNARKPSSVAKKKVAPIQSSKAPKPPAKRGR